MKNLLKSCVWILGVVYLLIIPMAPIKAQDMNPSNLTNSPYSRYGMGKLGTVGNTSTRAMGDIGIALRTSSFTNLANPASLTAIDTLTMLFDTGLTAEWASFSENGRRSSDWNAGFSYMSFHFPLWRNFAMSLSLTPYTMVGYSYGGEDKVGIDGALTPTDSLFYSQNYAGDGGLSKMMAGIGWKPITTKNASVSVGVNAGYIFGTVDHAGSVSISTGQGQNTIVNRQFTARGMDLELGIQFQQRLNSTHSMIFGATFSPKTPLKVDAQNLKYSNTDTVSFDSNLSLRTPLMFGVGLTYVIDRKLIAGAEFAFENWSKVAGLDANLQKKDDIYKNITKFAVGLEYRPELYSQNYLKTIRYRLGANYKTSYIDVYGSQNKEFTLSAGFGFPLKVQKRSMLNFAAEYTRLQPSRSGLLSEDYLRFTLGITFNELMFFRNKLR